MRDYADDYLEKAKKPIDTGTRVVLKVLILGFLAAAVTDLLRTHTQLQGRLADLLGVLSGISVQQIVPPRLSASKFVLVLLGISVLMVTMLLLHL
jgi:hypothetical protein